MRLVRLIKKEIWQPDLSRRSNNNGRLHVVASLQLTFKLIERSGLILQGIIKLVRPTVADADIKCCLIILTRHLLRFPQGCSDVFRQKGKIAEDSDLDFFSLKDTIASGKALELILA